MQLTPAIARPAAPVDSLQYNDAGVFGAGPDWDDALGVLTATTFNGDVILSSGDLSVSTSGDSLIMSATLDASITALTNIQLSAQTVTLSGSVSTTVGGPLILNNTLTFNQATDVVVTAGAGTLSIGSATLTAATFIGALTGNVTGNVSGSSGSCTGNAATATTATTAGSATTAGTVTTAAQPAITSVGTLTTLTVDDITVNGNTISSAGASTLAITPTAGQAITFDGTVTLDAGVIAGATSITSTTFVGALTGNASTATALASARTIGGVSFDGTANITVASATGGFAVTGSASFTTTLISTTALATPSALSATQATVFASTVSGAAIMGYGTTNDVALMNRAGTVVLGVGPNTTAVNMAGVLVVAGSTITLGAATSVVMTATSAALSIGAASFTCGALVATTGAFSDAVETTTASSGLTLRKTTGALLNVLSTDSPNGSTSAFCVTLSGSLRAGTTAAGVCLVPTLLGAFPTGNDGDVLLIRSDASGGAVPFTGAGSLIIRTRVAASAIQSSVYVYTGSPTTLALTIGHDQSVLFTTSTGLTAPNGAKWVEGYSTEVITLVLGGVLVTNSVANLLPANSVILSVVARQTTAITGLTTTWQLGDPTTPARFTPAVAVATVTAIGLNHMQGSSVTDATGPVQTAAEKVRITVVGVPTAGAIRVTVFYRTFTAPTS